MKTGICRFILNITISHVNEFWRKCIFQGIPSAGCKRAPDHQTQKWRLWTIEKRGYFGKILPEILVSEKWDVPQIKAVNVLIWNPENLTSLRNFGTKNEPKNGTIHESFLTDMWR